MSVGDFKELSLKHKIKAGIETYTLAGFVAVTDPDGDTAADVAGATGVPALGDEYESTGTYCNELELDHAERLKWKITAQYTSVQLSLNPADDDNKYDWSTLKLQEIITKDSSNADVVNSAGDAFNPPLSQDKSLMMVRVTKNETTWAPGTIAGLVDKTNASSLAIDGLTGAARTWLLDDVTSREAERNGTEYREVVYTLIYNPDTWDRVVLDAGVRQVVGGKFVPIVIEGQKATEPVPLDGAGAALAVGANTVEITFQTRATANLGSLSL